MNTLFTSIIRGALLSLLLGCVSFAAQPGRARVSTKQLENQYKQEELTSRQNDQQASKAKQARAELLRKAQDTLQTLHTLAQQATSFFNTMETLLDSDTGKYIARDGGGFTTYIDLQNRPAATVNEITLKTDAASALLNRLQLAEEGPDVGFVPSVDDQHEADNLQTWAATTLTSFTADIATLNRIAREAPHDIDLTRTKPLRTAVEESRTEWRKAVADYRSRGQKLASEGAKETILLAAYQAELDRAQAVADRIRNEMQATIDKMKQEYELDRLKRERQFAEELSVARQQTQDKLAQIQRDEKAAQTDRNIKDRTAAIDRDAKLSAMDRQELIALAKSPEVQQLLAPFLASGYWQPGLQHPAYSKTPVSLNHLSKFGALRATSQGLQSLLTCGTTPNDKDRPRWPFPPVSKRLTSDEHDKLLQAQQYLIQLGSIMVELGLLAE